MEDPRTAERNMAIVEKHREHQETLQRLLRFSKHRIILLEKELEKRKLPPKVRSACKADLRDFQGIVGLLSEATRSHATALSASREREPFYDFDSTINSLVDGLHELLRNKGVLEAWMKNAEELIREIISSARDLRFAFR